MNIENNGRLEDKLVEVRLYSSECQNAVNGPIILYHLVGGGGEDAWFAGRRRRKDQSPLPEYRRGTLGN